MSSSPAASSTSVLIETEARRQRTKERLYVLFQAGAWSVLLIFQCIFTFFLANKQGTQDQLVTGFAMIVFTLGLGFLITHYTRPLMTRWGWKDLGGGALVPRVLATSGVQSALWTGVGFAYPYLVLQLPWSIRAPVGWVMAMSWINGWIILTGWLCVYFSYHVFDRFNRLQIEQLRLATHVKDAELRALKSQVNPHFIFNALNSLRALIDEQPARARQAVTQLANLLRYSLQSAQLETVPFEDELRIVNDYLALEQVRHEERLRVRLDVAPETLTIAVPPLLLQTLVENAVKYGISPRPEGGELAIVARCRDGRLELRVINPGDLQPRVHGAAGGSTGLGLKNAAERLRLFFGDRARLELRAEGDAHVVAEVSIPLPALRG